MAFRPTETVAHTTVLFFATIAVFWESNRLDFAFDDGNAIVNNKDVTAENRSVELWYDDFWGRPMNSESSHHSWRPLIVLSFRLERYWNNGLDPGAFHMTNVCLHAIVTLLVYSLIRTERNSPTSAFIGALSFAVHPAHVESVTGIVGRADIVSLFFLLLTHHSILYGYYICSGVAFSLALLSKEIAITYVGVILLYVIRDWRDYLSTPKPTSKSQAVSRKVSPIIPLFLAALSAVYLSVRMWLCSQEDGVSDGLGESRLIRKTEVPLSMVPFGLYWLLSVQVIWLKYFELLFLPSWFSCEYAYNCLPMVDNFSDARLPFVGLMYLCVIPLFVASVIAFFSRRDSRLLISLVWIAAPLAPASHIFITVGTLVAERLLYTPSVGLSLLIAQAWDNGATKTKNLNGQVRPVIVILLAWFTHLSLDRIPDWENFDTIFAAYVRDCPDSAKANVLYHQILLRKENITGAKFFLDRARHIHEDWCDLDLHYGSLAAAQNDLQTAMDYFIKSLTCIYTSQSALSKLQLIFKAREELVERSGIKDPYLHADIARLYETIESYDVAFEEYKKAALVVVENKNREHVLLGLQLCQKAFSLITSGNLSAGYLENNPYAECQILYSQAMFLEMGNQTDSALSSYIKIFQACKPIRPGALSRIIAINFQQLANNGETLESVTNIAKSLSLVASMINGKPTGVELEYLEEAVRMYDKCIHIAELEGEEEAMIQCKKEGDKIRKLLEY